MAKGHENNSCSPVEFSPFLRVSGLLEPRSIAVVGASDRAGNQGAIAVRSLLKFGYPGDIWPVHPREKTVGGLPCFATPAALPHPADLALLAVPTAAVIDAVRDCAAAGIRHGIVWAGGFAELGGAAGERQQELAELCREMDFSLCGPNCNGIINSHMPMIASFASQLAEVDRLPAGDISIISQSGMIASFAQFLAQGAGFGCRYVVSTGNEAVTSSADYLLAAALDAATRVICLYIEGVRDGAKLTAALAEARRRRKPVIILKGGASAASARAAAAHTGSLAGEDRVWNAVLRDAAAIRVDTLEEMVDLALLFSSGGLERLPQGPGVGVITFGGGGGVLSADQCARNGLTTPTPEAGARDRLRSLVPPVASVLNPFDLTPETYNKPAWLDLLPRALDAVAADPEIHTIFFSLGALPHVAQALTDNILDLRRRSRKLIVASWPLPPPGVVQRLAEAGVHTYSENGRALRATGHAVRYGAALSCDTVAAATPPPASGFDWQAAAGAVAPSTVIPEHECHRLLSLAGLPMAPGGLAPSRAEVARIAGAVGYPVALKGISPAVTHRAAAGLVALGLATPEAVEAAYDAIMARAAAQAINLDGVYVQHMVPGGVEILVSAFRDPLFGTMISCGAGGTLTEVIDDVVLARGPVDEAAAHRLLSHLRIFRHAARQVPPPDAAPLAAFVVRFSQVAAAAPWQRFVLELNPVKWTTRGVTAVDGLLLIEQP